MTLYRHWTEFDMANWEWPNFTPEELSCKHCGQYWHDEYSLDLIQSARTHAGKPFKINSAHRCAEHNASDEVRGSKNSEHLRIAFDISLHNHKKEELLESLFQAGFTTFGMYNSFIHTDRRPWRRWYMATGALKKEWQDIYARIVKE